MIKDNAFPLQQDVDPAPAESWTRRCDRAHPVGYQRIVYATKPVLKGTPWAIGESASSALAKSLSHERLHRGFPL